MNTAINCLKILLLSHKLQKIVGLNFEVMCYMTHKCNKDKIRPDIWKDSDRNIKIDPNNSNYTLQNVQHCEQQCRVWRQCIKRYDHLRTVKDAKTWTRLCVTSHVSFLPYFILNALIIKHYVLSCNGVMWFEQPYQYAVCARSWLQNYYLNRHKRCEFTGQPYVHSSDICLQQL